MDKLKLLGDSTRKLSHFAFDDNKAILLPNNTLLVGCIGDIGKLGVTTDKCSTNQQITAIYPKKDIDVNYLYYWFLANKSILTSYSNNAVVPILNNKILSTIEVPIFNLITQKKIAAILDAADEYRQKTKALIDKYDQLAQSLFLDTFGDPVKNPKGWNKVEMGQLMTIVRGGSPRPIDKYLGGIYPWIKISDGTKGNDIYLDETKEHIIKEGLNKTRLLPAGSLIFANCGVSLGFARIITFEGCIHDGWLAFSDINQNILNKIFILKTLNSITQYFRDTAPDGTQPNLNTSIMKSFGLIVPPITLQNKYAEELELIIKQKQQANVSLQKAEGLFNSLLQRAFNGELINNQCTSNPQYRKDLTMV